MKVIRRNESIAEERERENLSSEVAKNKAYTDYIAMMAGIDLPEPAQDEGMKEAAHYEE